MKIKPWCGVNRHGVLLDATKNLLKSLKEQYTFEAFLIEAFNLMKAAKSFLSPEDFEELTTYLEKLVQEGAGGQRGGGMEAAHKGRCPSPQSISSASPPKN